MEQKSIIAVILGLILIVSGFTLFVTDFSNDIDVDEIESDDDDTVPIGNITSFDDAVNAFSFDFFRKLKDDPENDGNIFYSPYSVFTALAMTYEGSRNTTAEEMESVLHIEQDNESFHQYMRSLYDYLNENSVYNISTANALWVNDNFQLLDEYVNVIESFYGGKSSEIDFSDPEVAAEIINEWVESQTNNLIKDLVPASVIDPILTMLILTNAIYFKGAWEVQFDEANTTERDFTTNNAETVQVETMSIVETQDRFNYTETDEMQMLELPYSGDEISMMIILPKDGYEVSDITGSINKDAYNGWIDDMYDTELDLYLPKFKFETSYNLNDYLKELGMIEAFDEDANFTGIFGYLDVFISDVLHKAYIEVNEEGTEAAAATAVIVALTAINGGGHSRIVFDADHPFLFTLHHKETGTILFMGEVADPSE